MLGRSLRQQPANKPIANHMSQSVKVKVRPGRTIQFPAICVRCSRPAGEQLTLKRRRGRLTRLIDVPLCDECAAQLRRQSGDEERLGRLGRFIAVLIGLLTLIIAYILLPGGLPLILRLFMALALAVALGKVVLMFFRSRSLAAAHPEKLAILDAARMTEFSWRATTFRFNNDDFAQQFTSLNELKVMHDSTGDA